jgi:peptidoglycan/LPS O-acetylase OafA/YrhL
MNKAILMFLIPALFAIAGMFIISSSKTAEVEHKAAAYGPGTGYQQVPEEYTVTASTSYKWHHGTRVVWMIVVGFVLFAAAGFYVYVCDQQVWQVNKFVLIILVGGGLLMIFGKHLGKYYEIKNFQRTISAEQYEANKDNLDAIFLQ